MRRHKFVPGWCAGRRNVRIAMSTAVAAAAATRCYLHRHLHLQLHRHRHRQTKEIRQRHRHRHRHRYRQKKEIRQRHRPRYRHRHPPRCHPRHHLHPLRNRQGRLRGHWLIAPPSRPVSTSIATAGWSCSGLTSPLPLPPLYRRRRSRLTPLDL